jgi:hypothetical protein
MPAATLTNPQELGTWQIKGHKLFARTFGTEVTKFWNTQSINGKLPGEDGEEFILRGPEFVGVLPKLSTDPLKLASGLVIADVIAALTTFASNAGANGYGNGQLPSNFTVPSGYTTYSEPEGQVVIKKAIASGTNKGTTANTDTAVAAKKWYQKTATWLIAGGVVVVGLIVYKLGFKKKGK